jgi:hypothetical protein
MKKAGKVHDIAKEKAALLLPVRNVLGSHLEQETTYPDCHSWFSSVRPGKRKKKLQVTFILQVNLAGHGFF